MVNRIFQFAKKVSSLPKLTLLKLIALFLLLCGVLVLVILTFIPNSPTLSLILNFLGWVEKQNKIGASFLIMFSAATTLVVMIPVTPWNLACGYLFGFWIGSVIAVSGVTLGAVAAFFLGRFAFRSWTESLMKSRPLFRALDKAIEIEGFKLIFLTRLSPVLPFPLLNYVFGATHISFLRYLFSTILGVIPLTVAYAWIGTELRGLADIAHNNLDDTGQIIWFIVAIGSTIAVVIITTIITRKAIRDSLQRVEDEESAQQSETTALITERISLLAETTSLHK